MDVFLAQHCRLKAEKLKFGFETKALSKKSEKGKKQRDKYRKRRTIGDPLPSTDRSRTIEGEDDEKQYSKDLIGSLLRLISRETESYESFNRRQNCSTCSQ